MAFDLPPVRIALYSTLAIFSLVLLGLTAARLHYTTDIPEGDPVNGGVNFYDPIVVELLVTSLLTLGWSIFTIHTIHKRREPRFVYTFRGELIGLCILWIFYLCGAAIASSVWGDLNWCHIYRPCRILTAMLAFAWLGWIILTFLLTISIMFIVVNKALMEPMHGRWDPRASVYTGRQMSTRPNSGV